MHLQFKFDEPLLLQAVMLPMQSISAPVVRIHLWGHPAVGPLKRPFPEPNPLAALLGGGDAAASTEAAPARAASGGGPQVAVGSRASGGVTQRKPRVASG